jgi:hypothetical protein
VFISLILAWGDTGYFFYALFYVGFLKPFKRDFQPSQISSSDAFASGCGAGRSLSL